LFAFKVIVEHVKGPSKGGVTFSSIPKHLPQNQIYRYLLLKIYEYSLEVSSVYVLFPISHLHDFISSCQLDVDLQIQHLVASHTSSLLVTCHQAGSCLMVWVNSSIARAMIFYGCPAIV
jgi:hypothetical protein